MKEFSSHRNILETLPQERMEQRLRALGKFIIVKALLGRPPVNIHELDDIFLSFISDKNDQSTLFNVPQWALDSLATSHIMTEDELWQFVPNKHHNHIKSSKSPELKTIRLRRAFIEHSCMLHAAQLQTSEINTFSQDIWPFIAGLRKSQINQSELLKAKSIKDQLDRLNIAFGGNEVSGFGMQTSPESVKVTPSQWNTTELRGRILWSLLSTVNQIYRCAIEDPGDQTNKFILHLLEGDAPPKVIHWQRLIFNRINDLSSLDPFFFRLDQVSIGGKPIEFESWGSGMGFQHAVQAVMEPNKQTLAENIAKQFQHITNKTHPNVAFIEHNPLQVNESRFFVEECNRFGIAMQHVLLRDLASLDLSKIDAIKRPRFRTLIDHPRGEEILQRWLSGNLVIEPPPNILLDEKIIMALPFLPQTLKHFSEETYTNLMETLVVSPQTHSEIVNRLQKEELVLKYAGHHPVLRGNARAVFKLSSNNSSETITLLKGAMDFFLSGGDGPWIVQPRDKHKYNVRIWNSNTNNIITENRLARFNPAFVHSEKRIKLVNFTANFAHFWKVAGGKDTLTTAVEVN